jgi:hypothetical protein
MSNVQIIHNLGTIASLNADEAWGIDMAYKKSEIMRAWKTNIEPANSLCAEHISLANILVSKY